jgi:hypothetical protein
MDLFAAPLAENRFISHSGARWTEIYHANRHVIDSNPDVIGHG